MQVDTQTLEATLVAGHYLDLSSSHKAYLVFMAGNQGAVATLTRKDETGETLYYAVIWVTPEQTAELIYHCQNSLDELADKLIVLEHKPILLTPAIKLIIRPRMYEDNPFIVYAPQVLISGEPKEEDLLLYEVFLHKDELQVAKGLLERLIPTG